LRQALAIERARSALEDEKRDRAAAPVEARDTRDNEDGKRSH
jgi:hypothetical protein